MQQVAALELVDHRRRDDLRRLLARHRLVEVGIERFAERLDLLDPESTERVGELPGDHLDAAPEIVGLALSHGGSSEVVDHRQDLSQRLGERVAAHLLALPIHPLAEVVEVGEQSQVAVPQLGELAFVLRVGGRSGPGAGWLRLVPVGRPFELEDLDLVVLDVVGARRRVDRLVGLP